MSDITIDIINPVRPYILFKAEDDHIRGYVDTHNIDKGIRFFGRKDEKIEEAYDSLKGWIKPLWDKRQNGGNDNRDWLINTPIDQLVVDGCPTEIRKVVDNLKALAIFYKYSSRKIEDDSYVEMYSYGDKEFTEEEREYVRRGEQLDISNRVGWYGDALFYVTTDDDKVLTDIEKHLYEIKPHRHHLLQLEIDKVKHLITNESSLFGKNDWMGFVLDNPTKERLKEVQKWAEGLDEDCDLSHFILFGAVQEGDEVHYKVMYLVELWDEVVSIYRDGCYRPSGFLSAQRYVSKYSYNRMDFYESRKWLLDEWLNNGAKDNDYCLLKRGKTLDIRTRDGLVSGVMEDTSGIWPYLKPDLCLVDKPEAQYYCYLKAYNGYFGDEKGQVLLDIEDL
jgi:hypothetical protein